MTKVEAPFRALEFQFAAPEMLIDLQAIGSQFSVGSPTQLDKIKNLHSTDSIDTESLSTRGWSVWVHSSQVRLLDSSVP